MSLVTGHLHLIFVMKVLDADSPGQKEECLLHGGRKQMFGEAGFIRVGWGGGDKEVG